MGELKVTKHNALIESACYRLSMTESRIIFYGISLINPTTSEFPSSFTVDIGRYADMYGLDKNHLYKEIKQVARKKLFRREFSYRIPGDITRVTSWLSGMEYQDKSGYIKLFFPETIRPLLHDLKQNFTTYNLEYIAGFKSVYSIRLYEQAILNLNKHNRKTISYFCLVSELKARLDISDKYAHFPSFKRDVLERSKKEINKNSDVMLDYEIIKEGRKPYKIKFVAKRKAPKQKAIPRLEDNKPASEKEKLLERLKNTQGYLRSLLCQRSPEEKTRTEEEIKNLERQLEELKT